VFVALQTGGRKMQYRYFIRLMKQHDPSAVFFCQCSVVTG